MQTKLTKNEKRFLSRLVCVWCEHRLDRDGCGAIWEKCSQESRDSRREQALKTYKPRKAR